MSKAVGTDLGTKEDTEKMVSEAEHEKEVERVKNQLKSYAISLKSSVGETSFKEKLGEEDAKKLDTAAQEAINWLDASQAGSIAEFQDRQKQLEALASPIMTNFYGAGGAPGVDQHRSAKKTTGKIIVTGATGHIGKHTFPSLLKRHPASNLIALVRDPAKADDLVALGIEVRQGDYFDYASLVRAFEGVEKVMLVSAHAFTDRNTQHYNVITAARQVGVKHIVFMSIKRKEGSDFTMPEVSPSDLFAEATLKASGLAYTIVRHPPFLDVIQFYIGDKAFEQGIHMAPGDGKFTAVTRKDLAEAHAVILSEPGHENKTYSLTGYEPVSFADIAGILGKARNIDVPYSTISDQSYIDALTTKGFPFHLAKFVHLWVVGMQRGEWDEISGDLETLLGRKPTSPAEFLSSNYPVPTL